MGFDIGMLIANVPVVLAGQWIMDRLPLQKARLIACVLYLGLGVMTLLR